MLHPPSSPSVIYSRHDALRSNYLFLPRLHSFPLFRQQDTLLSSFCRIYEIRVLMRLVPEMQDVYESEERYFWNRWNGTFVHEVPDPRTRWEGDVVWEVGEMWAELVELVREFAGR